MFNLDERYHSYLTGDKKLRIDGVEEKVKGYGYTDNGKDIVSFTILNDGGTYLVFGQLVSFGGV